MDYKAIINLIKEVNQTGLTKLEIESDGVRIFMEKAPLTPAGDKPHAFEDSFTQLQVKVNDMPVNAAAEPMKNIKDAAEAASDNTRGNEDVSDAAQADIPGTKKILSPMVGTFYSQASPDKPPFVKAGDTIKAGQTICIIEAMKLMNEIESEYDGEIVEVLVNNEEMVEYGQPLFIIR